MSSATNQGPNQLGRLSELEAILVERIDAACLTLGRAESLDDEQRAEIHAILQAMRHEGQSHRAWLAKLAGGPAGVYISSSAARETINA